MRIKLRQLEKGDGEGRVWEMEKDWYECPVDKTALCLHTRMLT